MAKAAVEGNKDTLLEALRAQLSDEELKAILRSTGLTAVAPKPKHVPYETGYTKFIVVSDTHIGHSKFREDWWDFMIERGAAEDVDFAFHAGDILEGMSNRPGHVYELTKVGFEAQFGMAKRLIGECPFEFKAIIGNHDLWYAGKADQGINVGMRLEESLGNFTYLGAEEADVTIENIKVKLWHGNDGGSYATSYRSQKFIESLDGGDKPHILITGHDHKSIFYQARNVHVIGAGTLCEQTSFMRGKKLAAHRGFWIVEAWSNEDGLSRIRPEWYAFY
jgi:DNA polymerase II small subunit/DNA polymerase delta subunit B